MDEDNNIRIKNKKFRPRKKKNKLVLVFDEDARREFLTGFHKRKLQRRNKAKEEFEKQLKSERKRIKHEAKEAYKKLLLSHKPIPELENFLSEEIDMGSHSVSITELSTNELAKKNNWIGANEVQYEENNCNENSESDNETQSDIEGLELKKSRKGKLVNKNTVLSNTKDIKKALKLQATQNVKKSKIFQKKFKLEKLKNIHLKKKQERKQEKLRKKNKRLKNKKS